MSKSTKTSNQYKYFIIFLYFGLNEDIVNVNNLFSISLLIYESGTCAEKFVAHCKPPHSNPE